jgi:hypothetical protein
MTRHIPRAVRRVLLFKALPGYFVTSAVGALVWLVIWEMMDVPRSGAAVLIGGLVLLLLVICWHWSRCARTLKVVRAADRLACPECLYPLPEDHGECPECGRPYDAADVRATWERVGA